MAELPSGMVTFLFTDIEGSTRLWERYPVVMQAAVAWHDVILSEIIARHGGHLFKHVGDAVLAAFVDPVAAVSAVTDAQRVFATRQWPDIGFLLVRMALHCGDAVPNAVGDYDQIHFLNRLSRLLSTGSGGQILLSHAVRRSVAHALPADVSIVELGKHRLRDLLEPERVAQLNIDGLAGRFPPLKSLEGYPTNLPRQPYPLVDRVAELKGLYDLLVDPHTRFVTITGPGGVGKTRLALQAGADLLDLFEDGVWLIGLGSLEDPALIIPAIAEVFGVREGSDQSLEERLEEYLSTRTALLILDNFEHLLEAAADLTQLIDGCPNLTVIATSRQPLDLRMERVFPLGTLPTPAPPRGSRGPTFEEVIANAAVELFVQRARAKSPSFALVEADAATMAAICRKLDGLPLAIELAAALTPGLRLEDLLGELDQRFDLLIGGARDLLPHQKALKTTIEWSYDRLSDGEKAVFRRLAVFAGAFTCAAAEGIVPAAGPVGSYLTGSLLKLIVNSMVRRIEDVAPARYILLESLRDFGRDQLDAHGEAALMQSAHAAYFLSVTRQADLTGPMQGVWSERLGDDHDNLRAAVDWAVATRDIPTAAGLVETLWRFWHARGYLSEGQRRVEEVIRLGERSLEQVGVALYRGAGALARAHGDHDAAARWLKLGLDAARVTGDRTSEAAMLGNLGGLALSLGDHDRAADLYQQCLEVSRELGDHWLGAHALSGLAQVAHYLEDIDRAEAGYRAALAIWEQGEDRSRVALVLCNLLLLLAPNPDRHDQAREFGKRCLAESRALASPAGIAAALTGLGIVAMVEGDLDLAARYHLESVEVCRESENRSGLATALGNLSLVVADQGDPAQAATLANESLELFIDIGDESGIATAAEDLANIACAAGAWQQATRLHAAAESLFARTNMPLPNFFSSRHQANLTMLEVNLGHAFQAQWQIGHGFDREALRNEAVALTLTADAATSA